MKFQINCLMPKLTVSTNNKSIFKIILAFGRDKVEAEVERLIKHTAKCKIDLTDPSCIMPTFKKRKQKYEVQYEELINPDLFLQIVADHRGYCPYGLQEALRNRDTSSTCMQRHSRMNPYLKSFDFSL